MQRSAKIRVFFVSRQFNITNIHLCQKTSDGFMNLRVISVPVTILQYKLHTMIIRKNKGWILIQDLPETDIPALIFFNGFPACLTEIYSHIFLCQFCLVKMTAGSYCHALHFGIFPEIFSRYGVKIIECATRVIMIHNQPFSNP